MSVCDRAFQTLKLHPSYSSQYFAAEIAVTVKLQNICIGDYFTILYQLQDYNALDVRLFYSYAYVVMGNCI